MRFDPIFLFAVITILISLITWSMDLLTLVHACISCRIERTIMGLLGIIMLLPWVPRLIKFGTYGLGFFGSYAASNQILYNLTRYQLTGELIMACCALMIIIIQVFYIHLKKDNNLSS